MARLYRAANPLPAEGRMKLHWTILAASVIALAGSDAAVAKKHHGTREAAAPAMVQPGPAFGGPRMIEVRPGLVISNWDCITDEGYGRWRPCSGKK
jgi:hypothetical protein